MDALTVLRREHTRIAQLFIEFDALLDCACAGRRALVRELDELVRRHIDMEEALIYHRISEAPEWADDRTVSLHSEEEHQLVRHLLDEIAQTECHQPVYVPRVHVLRDVLLHHMKEEETNVFPGCRGFAQVA